MSGILAGSGASGPEGRGVAPAASLVGVKVIDSRAQSSLGLIAQGIQWAVENRATYGIDAINLSIGDPTGCGDGTDVASQAVDAAVAAGIVVITAAGNSGPANCTIKSPAAAESAMTVGAMADTGAGGFSHAWFSSRGPTADGRIKPDISAPGVLVVIAGARWRLHRGQRDERGGAVRHRRRAADAAGQPGLTPAQIKDAMRAHRDRLGQAGPRRRVRLRAARRLRRAARRRRAARDAARGTGPPPVDRDARARGSVTATSRWPMPASRSR